MLEIASEESTKDLSNAPEEGAIGRLGELRGQEDKPIVPSADLTRRKPLTELQRVQAKRILAGKPTYDVLHGDKEK